jgi:hypothetical protein
MKLKVVIHEAEEDGYWAEVPAIAAVPPAIIAIAKQLKPLAKPR